MTDFLGQNNLSIAELFFQRVSYSTLAFPHGRDALYIQPVNDFLFAERMLYGRIDKQHNVIQLNQSFLKKIKSQAAPKKQLMALNFVVDAFEDLALELQVQGLAGKLDQNDPYLAEIRAYGAFSSPKTMYLNYLNVFRGIFLNTYLTPELDQKVVDFRAFVPIFFNFLEKAAAGLSVTKGSYVASNLCSPMVSGLNIDVADLDPSDDTQKQKFLESPNFPFLVLAAKKYGFFIDKFVPWRLTADIGSPAMLSYSVKYGASSERATLSTFYQLIGADDIVDLQRMAFDFYNTLVAQRQTLRIYKGTKLRVVCRQPATISQIEGFYPLNYWVDKYIDIRYIEKREPGSRGRVVFLKKTCLSYLGRSSLKAVLSMINDAFKGFDNFEGSFAKIKLKQSNARDHQNLKPTY